MLSFFKKNPGDVKNNAESITNLSKHLARNAIRNCNEDYESWSKFDSGLALVQLTSDEIFEGSYYFWTFNLSLAYVCLLKNGKEYGDKTISDFVEPVFSKIYLQSKSFFIQYIKEDLGINYFTFELPPDEVVLDRVTMLVGLPVMVENNLSFDQTSSIGENYSKYIAVVNLKPDVMMRQAIFNGALRSIERIMPIYAGAFKMMRDNIR